MTSSLTGQADSGQNASQSFAQQSLDAQAQLLPYALAFFAVGLPALVWMTSYAANAPWISASLVTFAIDWAMFYVVADWLKRHPEVRADVHARTRIHVMGGLLWSVTIAQITTLALFAGPARESILMAAVGAAVACFFFAAPSLPSLLVVGPAAAAAPVAALYLEPRTRDMGQAAWGAVALAMALSLALNRLLRRQFAMAAEREELIEARLQSLARVEGLAKSKSDILATLSHEIRNGLTGVAHVLAAAVGGGGRTAPSREQLAAALDAAQDLIGVLDATLDTETAEAGALVVAAKPFDPAKLAQGLVLLNRPAAAVKGLELSIHVESELQGPAMGAALGDPVRTRQILANLIGNALKYTVRGRVEVRVMLHTPDVIRIEVADTGPGLSPEELEGAFEPFGRVERTAAGVPGAGLGLSLSRRLAELMNGVVEGQGAVGVGCCFWLDLPYDAAAASENEAEPSETSGREPMAAGPLRVLIAEDDALGAAMLRTILEQLGHRVVHAHDGRRALELAQSCEFDLLMLDGRMPRMAGADITRAIRAVGGLTAATPIVAVIGGDAEEMHACIAAGADEVLRKPVTVSSVARALAGVLSARAGQVRPAA